MPAFAHVLFYAEVESIGMEPDPLGVSRGCSGATRLDTLIAVSWDDGEINRPTDLVD